MLSSASMAIATGHSKEASEAPTGPRKSSSQVSFLMGEEPGQPAQDIDLVV